MCCNLAAREVYLPIKIELLKKGHFWVLFPTRRPKSIKIWRVGVWHVRNESDFPDFKEVVEHFS